MCKGGWQKSSISDWGIVSLSIPYNPSVTAYAVPPPFTQGRLFSPTIILQITLLVSVKGRRLYRKIYFFKSLCYNKEKDGDFMKEIKINIPVYDDSVELVWEDNFKIKTSTEFDAIIDKAKGFILDFPL